MCHFKELSILRTHGNCSTHTHTCVCIPNISLLLLAKNEATSCRNLNIMGNYISFPSLHLSLDLHKGVNRQSWFLYLLSLKISASIDFSKT